jgi:hypothetical protein
MREDWGITEGNDVREHIQEKCTHCSFASNKQN